MRNSQSNTLLAGLLFDRQNHKLVPHTTTKKVRRYHYYVSQKLKTGDEDSGWRIPAKTIESVFLSTLKQLFASKQAILQLISDTDLSADDIQRICEQGKRLTEQIKVSEGNHQQMRSLIHNLIDNIILHTDKVVICFNDHHLGELFGIKLPLNKPINFTKPMTLRRRGQEMKLVIGGEELKASSPDPVLIKLVATAHQLQVGLQHGSVQSIKDFAIGNHIDHADAKRMLPLSYLAPDIVEAILSGHQPVDLTVSSLRNGYGLPILWSEQRVKLGFVPLN